MKKAWLVTNRAFFGFCLSFLFSVAVQAKSYCSLSYLKLTSLPQVSVDYVSDGDSLVLSDGRKLRLIAFNAPELLSKQPLSLQAKKVLSRLLAGKRLYMQLGEQSKDRYGRLLASLYLPDGRSVSASLLQDGWGFLIAIPPNIKDVQCMMNARDEAKSKRRGVWAQPAYRAKPAKNFHAAGAGFHRVSGQLQSFQSSSDFWWLRLNGDVVLRIVKEDQPFFRQKTLASAVGKQLLVSGWVVDRGVQKRAGRAQFMMLLTHQAHLKIL